MGTWGQQTCQCASSQCASSKRILMTGNQKSTASANLKYIRFRKTVENNPDWDFVHNTIVNLPHQLLYKHNFNRCLTEKAQRAFRSLLRDRGRRNADDHDSLFVWFEKESNGHISTDQLYSEVDEDGFFGDSTVVVDPVVVDDEVQSPTKLSHFFAQAERNFSEQNEFSDGFVRRFPSFVNIPRISHIQHLSHNQLEEVINSVKGDVLSAFFRVLRLERLDDKGQDSFIKSLLRGSLRKRCSVRKKFSSEVTNVVKFSISDHRMMEELIIAIAEELPEGAVQLTRGLSKGDEMRFIYSLFEIRSSRALINMDDNF